MTGGKIDVAADIGGGSTVVAVRVSVGVVGLAEMNGGKVVGIRPTVHAVNHLEPYADILHGANPRGVFYLAGVVEVERHAVGEDVTGVGSDLHGAPRAMAGCLHIAFLALIVGGEERGEGERRVVEQQVHARVVDEGCFVQGEPYALVGMEQESGLHTCIGEPALAEVVHPLRRIEAAYLAQTGTGVHILLCIEVTRNPVGGVVARHGELRALVEDSKVAQA